MTDRLDALLADIDEVLDSDGEDEDDAFSWTDSMVWTAPELTHDPATGRPYLDQAGWVL